MRLTFRVVLAVVAALTVSMAVNAQDSGCITDGNFCNSDADCCAGSGCWLEQIDVYASMSGFIQDLLTYQRGSLISDGYASHSPESIG
ncbi:hypothetical protein BDR03DRAFT_948568 [Suillus americanus]|nr:hypothetical protein BDR03DRAFT_948568 [Suillus americanus]